MAVTISTSDWTGANVRKTLSFQAALVSKLRIYKVKVTAGGSDAYATNGVSADLKEGRISVGGSAGAVFAELANSTSIANKVFEFLVIGY